MPEPLDSDVKTDGDSSTSPDVLEASSASQDASSQDANAGQSMKDFLHEKFKDVADSNPLVKDAEGEGSEDQKMIQTPEEKAEADKKKEAEDGEDAEGEKDDAEAEDSEKEEQDKAKEEAKDPVPYERFQEVVAKQQKFEQQVKSFEPKVQNYDTITSFCQQNQITPDQFERSLKISALLNTDPEAALKEILPIVEQLQGFVGNKLPGDLQKEVDSGDLPLARAKEIAKLRAQGEFSKTRAQRDEQLAKASRAQELKDEMGKAVSAWENGKLTSDPDYKPKAKETDPDGKWEDVRDKYLAMLNQTDAEGKATNRVGNVQDLVALMERAYTLTNDKWKRFYAKPATKKKLSSSGSSTNGNTIKSIENAPTMREAIDRALVAGGRK